MGAGTNFPNKKPILNPEKSRKIPMATSIRDTIARVAREEGIDPAYALAVAERESSFNPNSGGAGTIRGLFQFTGKNRRKLGLADDADAETQTRAFAAFTKELRKEMGDRLGRDPSHGELYTGHHLGGARAARIQAGPHGELSPGDIFSPREMAGNPHFAKAATGGALAQSLVGDIDRRMGKFGSGSPAGSGVASVDFAQHGQPLAQGEHQAAPASRDDLGKTLPPGAVDFASHGEAVGEQQNAPGGNKVRGTDFAQYGQPVEKVDLKVNTPMTGPSPAMGIMSGFSPSNEAEKTNTAPEAPGAYDRFADWPQSPNIIDNRGAPDSVKGTPGELLMDMMDRAYRPYTGGTTSPTPHRPATPLARDAGLADIPTPGNRVDRNSDLYLAEQERNLDPNRTFR